MQRDSVHFSTSDLMTHDHTDTEKSPIKFVHCSQCTLVFRSGVYLYEHLNKVHGYDVNTALREAGLKHPEAIKGNISGKVCPYQHNSCNPDVLNEDEKSENQNGIGSFMICENQETNIVISTDQHTDGLGIKAILAARASSTCTTNSSKDLKTYKRPLQTITKYFSVSSGSDGKPTLKLAESQVMPDSTKETLILQESPSNSNPNSSGVFKVTAKSMIDICKPASDLFLLNDHLLMTDLRSPKPEDQLKEMAPSSVGKRTNSERSESCPAKKVKGDKKTTQLPEKAKVVQQLSSSTDFSFEVSEDEGEKKEVYFCKHCDYSKAGIRNLCAHYKRDHPYIRYNAAYIQDVNDQSATFRCLECPVEFPSVAALERHYTENHPETPKVFAMPSHELNLVFKCFVCPFTTDVLRALKEHYKEQHPKHEVGNSLLYCRYSATRCQEGSSSLNACENTHGPERSEGVSPKNAHAQNEALNNPPSPQHHTPKGADGVLYHCGACDFSNKSVVVMHIHYQKRHPDQAVTIDKIKQSCATSPAKSEMTHEKSWPIIENSKRQKNILDPSKRALDKAQQTQQKISFSHLSLKCTPANSESHSESSKSEKAKLRDEVEASAASTTSSDSKTRQQVEVFSEKEPQHEKDGKSVTGFNPYACAEKLFYCQKCNFGNPTVKGVRHHQAVVHHGMSSSNNSVLKYSALIHAEIKKSQKKSQSKELPSSTHLPLPIINEGDEYMFFCQLCNYRQLTVSQVLKHYSKRHRGFQAKADQIHQYKTLVLKQRQTETLHLSPTARQEDNQASSGINGNKKKKTRTLAKGLSVSVSPSARASQTQRTLKCYRCSFSSQYVNTLRRHIWKMHHSNRTVAALLRLCFRKGMLEPGYHCDWCVFSSSDAAVLYKHYQEQHPRRLLSYEYVSTQLYVGPDMSTIKRKKSQLKHTDDIRDHDGSDGSLPSQSPISRGGQSETKVYSCRACSFKGSSLSGLTRHYRAIHPWSVKEDGSVLNIITSKKSSANSHGEDHSETSFDTNQEPPEISNSPGSSHEAAAAAASPTRLRCPFCPALFRSHHGLSTHCGMKHHARTEESDQEQEQQEQSQTRVHVFKCPYCAYINTNYHGILTHCQMRHPAFESRADSLHVDETHLSTCGDALKRKGPGNHLRFSGFMGKTCPQIFTTPEKLNMHCENDSNQAMPNAESECKPDRKAASLTRIKQSNTHSALSASKASSLRRRVYTVIKCQYCTYVCSTKIALNQHMCVHHRNVSTSNANLCPYKCVLCPRSYFWKKRLGNHYTTKHGREAFLKYFTPVYKRVPQKNAPTSPNCPLSQQAESTAEVCKSSTAREKGSISVYRCPNCPYVNASYHGTLTHCQMQHPAILARADDLKTEEILQANMIKCTMGKGSNVRGYMCKKCPQIHASLVKLKIHCEGAHNQHSSAASEDSSQTEKQPEDAVHTTETDLSQQLETPDKCQASVEGKESYMYKCYLCSYRGQHRRYLHIHYKKTHKLDARNTYKLLEQYDKRKNRQLPQGAPEEKVHCKKCPALVFDSSQLLIAHYSAFHSSDWRMDFTVLSRESKKSMGVYKCGHCKKQLYGIPKLCRHLDCHRSRNNTRSKAAKTSSVDTSSPQATSPELCRQEQLPMLETVEDLTQWNVTPAETFTLPGSPRSSPLKPTECDSPELELRENKHHCRQCRRTFMSLKGLRLHERSHATMAAIKKLDTLPPSALKHNINKYILYKPGTTRPFLCSFCSYRTTVLGLWRSHFMKNHQDILMDPLETDSCDEDSNNTEPPCLSEEKNNLPEPDDEPEMTESSLYLEPPDVQRQLNHYSLITQAGVSSKGNQQATELPDNSLIHCELCNFSTGHLSSIRRHYLNRHGKKILRCKDCSFITGLRKTLEMHTATGHSTCQSEATHQKDLRCPFCLYKTKNKNNMIDHIVLHREERVVPMEVRRSKLSRYLEGLVFRCHKCTFTSGSAENLRQHVTRHDNVKPYKCRLCYFDCIQLSDLEAHLSDKHQVLRNHELVGQVSLDQLEARVNKMSQEEEAPLLNLEHCSNGSEEREQTVTDCDDARYVNPAENFIRKKSVLQMKEVCPKHEQETQDQAGNEHCPETARAQRIGDEVEQNFQSGPEGEKRTSENQVQPTLRGGETSSLMLTLKKWGTAEGSSTTRLKIAENLDHLKLNLKTFQHRKLNIEGRADDRLHHSQIQKMVHQYRTVKEEQNLEIDSAGEMLGEEGSSTSAHNRKIKVDSEAKRTHMQVNVIRSLESFKVERHWLTLPSCAQQVRSQKHSEEATDPYGEMPVLENEYLKEEMKPIGCCKEEEESDQFEQKSEAITEDGENRWKDQERVPGGGLKEADNPHVHKGAATATGGAAEVLCSSASENKLYTCEWCGRNLTNSSELKCHVMRHGI